MSQAASHPARARPWRIAAAVAAGALALLVIVLAGLYLARRQIAREAVTDWLRARGIASQSEFRTLGPGHLAGRLRIGPADAPDLTVEDAQVDYSLAGLLAGRGVQVTSVRLVRPVLKARWKDGRFSAGSLDKLIAEFRKRPPKPGAPSPRIEIDQGRIVLTTDYGVLHATADALVDDAKLVRLSARSEPGRVSVAGAQAELGAAVLEARTEGGVLSARLTAPILTAQAGTARLRQAELTLATRGAYPDLTRPVPASGQADIELRAGSAGLGEASARPVRLAASSAWRWTRTGGPRLAGDLRVSGELHELAAADLRLASAAGEFTGDYVLAGQSALHVTGRAQARGGWRGLGAPAAGDSPEIAAVKRALADFRATAQGLAVSADGKGVAARLTAPVRLDPARGGEIRLAPEGRGYRLTASGGGLPKAEATIRRVSLDDGGLSAAGSVTAALSIGPLRGADIDAAGALTVAGGKAAFAASRCARVRAGRLELGADDVTQISAALCPAGGPLLRVGAGGWSLAGRAEHAAANVPFLQAEVSEGAAVVRMAERAGRLSAKLEQASARVRDTAQAERFRPMAVTGAAQLAGEVWTGAFDVAPPGGPRVAHAALRHDVRTGAGAVALTTPGLAFRPGGLQPADLSPAAAGLGAEVDGAAAFKGAVRWTRAGASGDGDLSLGPLDFRSPAGAVQGLSGEIRFTSLAPLIAPPGQTLHIARIGSALPITDVTAALAISETGLTASGEGAAGGGRLRLEALAVPFATDRPVSGTVEASGVQLHDLVEGSPFGDRVDLDAKVSGRIPFQAESGKVQIAGGELHAVAPGRLSIDRAALSAVSAQGSVQAPAAAAAAASSTDTFTDFAYQAMENLAFNTLDAQVDTQAGGRLRVLFHIVGYHDPPKHQEITISLWDLIRRKFMGRQLPLPSGTGVDLTLDTSLNLDDLLKDYADFERLRGSPPVQR